jgi:hypothetical protein
MTTTVRIVCCLSVCSLINFISIVFGKWPTQIKGGRINKKSTDSTVKMQQIVLKTYRIFTIGNNSCQKLLKYTSCTQNTTI